MERILITGSEGRIGKVLVPALANNFEVFGLDIKNIDRPRFCPADITKLDKLKRVFSTLLPLDAVVHLAGNPNELSSWEEIFDSNILGTRNVYNCAKNFGVKRVIFASSTHLIGSYSGYPQGPIEDNRILTVNDPPKPDGDYGSSKGYGELVARQFYDLYGLESVCIRVGAFRPQGLEGSDDPYKNIAISTRDLIQLFRKALTSNVTFGIYFGISNNPNTYLDISNVKKDLGYSPQDSFS